MDNRALWLPIFIMLFLSAAATAEANTYAINDHFESPATIDTVGWTFSGTAARSIASVPDGSGNAGNNALRMVHPANGSFTAKKTLPAAITSGNVTISFDFQRSAQVADYFYVYNADGSENFRILIQGSNGKGFNIIAPAATKVSPDVTSFLDSADTAIQSVFGVNANIPSTWVHLVLNIDMTDKSMQVSASIGSDLTPQRVKLMTATGQLADNKYLLHSNSNIGAIAFNSTAAGAHTFHADNVQVYTPAGLSISGPSPVYIPAADTSTFLYTSAYTSDTGTVDPSPSVIWSTIPAVIDGVDIDANGLLSVDSNASPGTVTVQASLNSDPTVTSSKTVTVSASSDATTNYMAFSYSKTNPSTNIPITVTPNGNSLLSVLYGGLPLTPSTDYTFESNKLTLSLNYLNSFASGSFINLKLHMSGGTDPALIVSVLDPGEQPDAATISNALATIDTTSRQIKLSGNISSGSGVQVTARGTNPAGKTEYMNQATTSSSTGELAFSYQPESLSTGKYSFGLGGAQTNTAVSIHVYVPSIDWNGMKLTGLSPNQAYSSVSGSVYQSVYDGSYQTDALGNMSIPASWFGETVTLTYVSDSVTDSRAAVVVAIPAQAPASLVRSVDKTADGNIVNTSAGMEYSPDHGVTRVPINGPEVNHLTSGAYLARVAAVTAAGLEALPSRDAAGIVRDGTEYAQAAAAAFNVLPRTVGFAD